MAPRKARSRTTGSDATTFAQRIHHAHDAEKLARLEQHLTRTRAERDMAQRTVRDLRERIDILERIDGIRLDPPDWLTPRKTSRGLDHRATVMLQLSDAHWDEVVDPAQVGGVNAYNREIAVLRLRRTLDNLRKLTSRHIQGIRYDGAVVILGGDMLSGSIHEELKETNEDTVFGSVDYWADHLAAFLLGMQDAYKRIHVVGIVGNHGRNTRKPRMKFRVRDNLDWLLYRTVMRETRHSNITWHVPETADAMVSVYQRTILATHGDQMRGGSGIAGIMTPIHLGQKRKALKHVSMGRPFHLMAVHHFHTYVPPSMGIAINGTLKGFDEFSDIGINAAPEPPGQSMWLETPEHGATLPAQVFCQDRKAEGW